MNYLPGRDVNLSIIHIVCGSPARPTHVPHAFCVLPWTWPVCSLTLYDFSPETKLKALTMAFSGLQFGLNGPGHPRTLNTWWPSDSPWKTVTQLNSIKLALQWESRTHRMENVNTWGLSLPTLVNVVFPPHDTGNQSSSRQCCKHGLWSYLQH